MHKRNYCQDSNTYQQIQPTDTCSTVNMIKRRISVRLEPETNITADYVRQ